jgi:hypothetical protein
MLLYRSFVVGLLGAIAMLLAILPRELRAPAATAHPDVAAESPAIANVSRSALERSPAPFGITLATAVGLRGGEWIVGIDGELATDRFLEVTVSDGHASRQVLLLVRP